MSNQVLEAIKKRSSARAYSSEPLAKEALNSILEAGLQAPTGMNRKEIRFSVVNGDHPVLDELDTEMRRLRGIEKQEKNFIYNAPVLIVLSAEDGYKWSAVDAGIAVQNMALAAESLGLGTVIIGCIYDALHGEKKAYFEEALRIPEGYSFQIGIAVGTKTDAKLPHDYDFTQQVTFVE
jgi:nitroreductase